MTDTYLFCDFETTGFKKSGPHIQDGQARACQLAMILCDHTGKSLAEVSLFIKPDNWQVSDYNINTCGITQEMCEAYGVHFAYAVGLFKQLAKKATHIIAHNANFDRGIFEIEEAYCAIAETREPKMPETSWYCTMETNRHLAGGKSLSNCVRHYLNREPTQAHNAMGDTIDCRNIFFAMKGIKI